MNKKEQAEKVIEQEKFSLFKMELMERWIQRQIIGGKKVDLILGGIQRDIKIKKDYLIFLEEVLKDL